MHYAIAHPDCVDKLIVSNSVPASLGDVDLFGQEWMRRMAPYQEQLTAIQSKPEFQELVRAPCAGAPYDPKNLLSYSGSCELIKFAK